MFFVSCLGMHDLTMSTAKACLQQLILSKRIWRSATAKKRSFRAVPRQENTSRHARFDNVNCESLVAAVGIF